MCIYNLSLQNPFRLCVVVAETRSAITISISKASTDRASERMILSQQKTPGHTITQVEKERPASHGAPLWGHGHLVHLVLVRICLNSSQEQIVRSNESRPTRALESGRFHTPVAKCTYLDQYSCKVRLYVALDVPKLGDAPPLCSFFASATSNSY